MKRFKSILVPIDFSECADLALKVALEMARDTTARVRVLHVMPPYQPWSIDQPFWAPDPGSERRAQKQLADHVAKVARGSTVRLQTEARWGDPAETAVQLAKRNGCDLIVMGTHGRSGWRRLVIGCVAEKVVRYAPCAVLTVPPAAVARRVRARKTRKK